MVRTKSDSPQYVSEVPNVAVADEAALASGQELAVDNKALEKRVMWKIDRWLVLFYSIVYVVRVIDSSNYANAAIINLENGTGIKKELGMESDGKDKLVEKFMDKVKTLNMPEAVRKVFDEELSKLQTLEPAASEFNVTRNYCKLLFFASL